MALSKCPRCELNYIRDGEKLCTVCRREMKGEEDQPELELCSACGERPASTGEDLCAACLREVHRLEGAAKEAVPAAETPIDPLAVTEMDEIEVETDEEDIPSSELGVIDRELGDGGEEEEEEDEDPLIPASLEQLEEEEYNSSEDFEDEEDL